jgi:hypothetical protein
MKRGPYVYKVKTGRPLESYHPRVCSCGDCLVCRGREASRRYDRKMRYGIPARRYVTDAELERRMTNAE